MMRSSAYNRFGVLMGTSWPASCPRWYGLREDSWPMITLFPSQGDFYATADGALSTSSLNVDLRLTFLSWKSFTSLVLPCTFSLTAIYDPRLSMVATFCID